MLILFLFIIVVYAVGNHPVLIRLFDVSKSHDKKKKESTLTEIARARIDLMPLLQGQTAFDLTVNADILVCAL